MLLKTFNTGCNFSWHSEEAETGNGDNVGDGLTILSKHIKTKHDEDDTGYEKPTGNHNRWERHASNYYKATFSCLPCLICFIFRIDFRIFFRNDT